MANGSCSRTSGTWINDLAARYTSGLWVGKFLKTRTYQEVKTPDRRGPAAAEILLEFRARRVDSGQEGNAAERGGAVAGVRES